jgi:hypothetical protein
MWGGGGLVRHPGTQFFSFYSLPSTLESSVVMVVPIVW